MGERFGGGGGGEGALNKSHLSFQDWDAPFFSLERCSNHEKYNVDYCFKCGGFRGFNANIRRQNNRIFVSC